ncbi:hypothetical protein [Nocardia sp. NPDC005366]
MPLQDPDQRIIIYRAADPDSQTALDRLGTAPGADPAPKAWLIRRR